jgi:hypothetical protein
MNRGESYHQLRRAVSYANYGTLRFKTESEQLIWSECSRLITNCIIYYNVTLLSNLQIKPLFIEPGRPWENGYIESFNGKMRDELLNGEIFYTLKEAIIIIEMWRKEYNTIRPHSSLGYQPPVPETILIPST